MLAALRDVPHAFPNRDTFIQALVERGLARPIAAWLGTNLRRVDGEYRFRLDLGAIQALLNDYREMDAWPILQRLKPEIHCVLGGRSPVVPPESKARFQAVTRYQVLQEAGHWVHVDDLSGLLDAFATDLPRL